MKPTVSYLPTKIIETTINITLHYLKEQEGGGIP